MRDTPCAEISFGVYQNSVNEMCRYNCINTIP